ncbi:MAG: family N-acetyltransferase [Segetibacter sp.]|jgi:ribosomal-protein-alanine N-acetyltransferase|nr:family N-acetyltransferase [Segetibacter sp.]
MENRVQIRSWKPEDAGPLAAICNNKKIWLNVRDTFPHPYTVGNAVEWISFTLGQKPIKNMAIVYNGNIAGSIGVTPKEDVYRKSIEIGYFVGEAYWGKGIATLAVAQMMEYIKTNFEVVRIYAEVFGHNKASMKVLKKNGFHLEGIREKAVIKNNEIMDDYVWVKFIER